MNSVLIIYLATYSRFEKIIFSIVDAFKEYHYTVDLLPVDEKGEVNVKQKFIASRYKFICIGIQSRSFLGGVIPEGIRTFLQKNFHLEGKKVAVFIIPRFLGSRRTAQRLMAFLEKEGAILFDQDILKDENAARIFGERLVKTDFL